VARFKIVKTYAGVDPNVFRTDDPAMALYHLIDGITEPECTVTFKAKASGSPA
jgi:hypothetical protein